MTKIAHEFSLVLSGVTEIDDALSNALFEAGCDDALVGSRDGVVFLDFDREADSFPRAVLSAIADVVRAKTAARVARIEPDDFVTASEIARRLGRTRESVRQLVNGTRGPGGFPAPIASLIGTSSIWSWAEVLRWFGDHHPAGAPAGMLRDAIFVAETNAALGVLGTVPSTRTEDLSEFVRTARAARSDGGIARAIERFLSRCEPVA